MENSKPLVKNIKISTISIISFIVLGFSFPNLTLAVSLFVFAIYVFFFCIEKKFEAWLKNLNNNLHSHSENEKIYIFGCLFILGIIFLAYNEWRYKALIFAIPAIATPLIVRYSTLLGTNTVIFLHIVSLYFFLRFYAVFVLKLGDINGTEIYFIAIKILLESIRIIFLFIGVLSTDGSLGFEIPRTYLEGIVATIAIDSIIKEIKNRLSKKDVPK